MFNRKTVCSVFLAVMGLLLAGARQSAQAFTPGACSQDAQKLCPGLTGKELTPCMKQHEGELSVPCKVNLAESREMVRQAMEACKSDIAGFCGDVKPGEGRLRKCLKAHESVLSQECQAKLTAAKNKVQTGMSTPPAAPAAAPAISSAPAAGSK